MNAVSIPGSEELEVLSLSCIEIVQIEKHDQRTLHAGVSTDGIRKREQHSFQADKGIEKRSSFIRKTLSSAEIESKDPPQDESTPKVLIAWKTFKCIVFLICLTYLIKQSAEFYWHFRTYPTNSNTRIAFPEESKAKYKFPAATLCYKNRISAAEFCEKYPNLCERPEKADEYCLKHPQFCPKNISDLVIFNSCSFSSFAPVLFVVCMNVPNRVKRLAVSCNIKLHLVGINFTLIPLAKYVLDFNFKMARHILLPASC
ncbi:hypothetical protein AVEN_255318-1 [Araneus ventricosus]|uniref:Uncharacterized protein n=1 Tax=Araneus ventricosus TaxID=182803 RepID=A0A4Y2SFG4_ARAVE|nr:hypothetical protein AVEN_255318-1 [Araneus ventricosus]